MQISKEKNFVTAWIQENTTGYQKLSEAIWNYPELGFAEFRSSRLIMEALKENGFAIDERVAGMPTAFVARWGSGDPVIGFNCEYDALPGLSQRAVTDRRYVVEGGPGHGCGHNLLGTGSVMAATAIKAWLERVGSSGTIKVFGTPAEENGAGKAYMARAGCFSEMDACLDWHPFYYNSANYDTCNSFFSMRYCFTGRTAHGNSPWTGRSALDSAVLMGHAIEMLREHIPPGRPPEAANTVNYTFSDVGPESPTVVPDRSTVWVVGRITTHEEMLEVVRRVDRCAEAAALATETQWRKIPIVAIHEKIPNRTLSQVLYNNFCEVGSPKFDEGEQLFAKRLQQSLGAEENGLSETILDFGEGASIVSDNSEYSWFAPFAMIWVVAAPPGIGWHKWQIAASVGTTIGTKAMVVAAKVLANSALELFINPEILKLAQAEREERLRGRQYRSLVPDEIPPPIDLNIQVMEKYRALLDAHLGG